MTALTAAEANVIERRGIATWAARTASKDTCANPECGRYVGFEHRLVERTPECILGSEVDQEALARSDEETERNFRENVEYFLQNRIGPEARGRVDEIIRSQG